MQKSGMLEIRLTQYFSLHCLSPCPPCLRGSLPAKRPYGAYHCELPTTRKQRTVADFD